MIVGYAAMTSGFTATTDSNSANTTEPTTISVGENGRIKVSEHDDLTRVLADAVDTPAKNPTTISVGENGRIKVSEHDDLTRALADVVEETLTQTTDETTAKTLRQAVDEVMQDVELPQVDSLQQVEEVQTVEKVQPIEEPAPEENVVETVNGYLPYLQVMEMEATAYLPTDGSGEGLTAMGIPATYGIVAVDPSVIPLGTRVYIPGYGEALAADTGGAIYGYKIDLCMENYYEAMDFGRRYVTVFVLK